MEKNLEKVKNALPVLEAKIKELAGAEIKLYARIKDTMSGQVIVIFSDDLKSQIMSGIAAPIFKEIDFETRGGRVDEINARVCFFPNISYGHYSGGYNGTDYIWRHLIFDLNCEQWLFNESQLIKGHKIKHTLF